MHLKVAFNWDQKPLYDVIARIHGSTFPDEWVIRGNHHDAWVNGAEDPLQRHGAPSSKKRARSASCASRAGRRSGRSSTARGTAKSRRCSDRRSGSRQHAAELQQHAVVYINSDGNGRGFLQMEGSHVARALHQRRGARHPRSRDASQRLEAAAGAGDRARPKPSDKDKVAQPRATCASARSGRAPTTRRSSSTSASPSLNIGYGGEDEDGIYHSIYDDFYFYTHFLDTDFAYGRTLAQTGGTAVIRLADADLLPFEFSEPRRHRPHVRRRAAGSAEEDARTRFASATARSPTASSRRSTTRAGRAWRRRPRPMPPAIDFAPIARAIDALTRQRGGCTTRRAPRPPGAPCRRRARARSTRKLRGPSSSCSTRPACAHRDWFKHLLYAPGFYTGYGVKTMPGVREAIEQAQYASRARRGRPRRQGVRARSGVAREPHARSGDAEVNAV